MSPQGQRPIRTPKVHTQPRLHKQLMAIMDSTGVDSTPMEINVGKRLREIRESHGLSIRGLADLSGLNFNTLSLIENGKSSPSVSTLQRISTALGIPITAFFESIAGERETLCQKSGQRPRAVFSNGLLEDLGCSLTLGNGVPLLITLEPGADSGSEMITHTGVEFVYCLEGTMNYLVGDQELKLDKDDSLIFEAYLPHRWENGSSRSARFMLILCPSDERDVSAGNHFPSGTDLNTYSRLS